MKASLQQQPMYCSRDHNYTSRLNQQYEKSTQYLFFSFLHVLLHLCNSCTMLYCTLLYGVVLYSSCIYVCNSHENSYPAFLLLLHTTYIVYLLYFWCFHDSLFLWYLLSLIPDFVMCRYMCTCVILSSCTIFGTTISHADCGILFSKCCRSKPNATQSSLKFCTF